MWKSNRGWKRGHYDVQMQIVNGKGRALQCGNKKVDATGGNIMCKLKGQMDKGRHDDVEMKRRIQNRVSGCAI